MDSKSLSHTRWKCQYHIVFIPKYRKKKLFGQLKLDVREILSTLCKYKGVEIIEGAVHCFGDRITMLSYGCNIYGCNIFSVNTLSIQYKGMKKQY